MYNLKVTFSCFLILKSPPHHTNCKIQHFFRGYCVWNPIKRFIDIIFARESFSSVILPYFVE